MKTNTKLTIALLVLAAVLLYVVNAPAKDFEYKPIKVSESVTISIDNKTTKLITFTMEIDGNLWGIISANCKTKQYAFNDVNGNGTDAASKLSWASWDVSDPDEIKALTYVCTH